MKRDEHLAPVRFDKITDRNAALCVVAGCPALRYVAKRLAAVTQEVTRRFKNKMTTHDLDMLTAAVCADFSSHHGDYAALAARILVSDLQKTTRAGIGAVAACLGGRSRVSAEYLGTVARAAREIDARLDFARDFLFDCFGFQTMVRGGYLLRAGGDGGAIVERPQHFYMRVALTAALARPGGKGHELPAEEFRAGLARAFRVYDLLSTHRLTHASATMISAGCRSQQLASCFLVTVADSLDSLLSVVKDTGMMSKGSGGIGTTLTPMRAQGSLIRGTGGTSGGLRPYIRLLQKRKDYVSQGKRPGADALYLEPWHADVFTFLEMGRAQGVKGNARRMKYALWVPDMFMEALVAELAGGDGTWHLFNPSDAPGLHLCHGEEFRALHAKYVREKRFARAVKASDVMREWFITVAQAGNPYILFKDNINLTSNLSHVRTIAGSNLCGEITIPSWYDEEAPEKSEYGVCFLAALPLASFIVWGEIGQDTSSPRVDWAALMGAAAAAVRNLDNFVDVNVYPVAACRRSSERHRPLGIGAIGLADVLARLRLPYGGRAARALDRALHAAIYFAAMRESSRLGAERGNFATFAGSAAQRGLLQPDMWAARGHLAGDWAAGVAKTTGGALTKEMWDDLRARCRKHLRNAYVTSNMPTATSSQVVRQNESTEPFTSNLYTRRTLAGDFVMLNPHLVRELESRGLWDEPMRLALLAADGSVQGIERVPAEVRRLYRTARELDQRLITAHAAARNPFLSQTQSLNYFFGEPNLKKVLSVIVMGWKLGLTTGSYYIHTQAAQGAQKTTTAMPVPKDVEKLSNTSPEKKVCSLDDKNCESCSV